MIEIVVIRCQIGHYLIPEQSDEAPDLTAAGAGGEEV